MTRINVKDLLSTLKRIEIARDLDTPDEAFENIYKMLWVEKSDECLCKCDSCFEAYLNLENSEEVND